MDESTQLFYFIAVPEITDLIVILLIIRDRPAVRSASIDKAERKPAISHESRLYGVDWHSHRVRVHSQQAGSVDWP